MGANFKSSLGPILKSESGLTALDELKAVKQRLK